jgi:hypothetical protein
MADIRAWIKERNDRWGDTWPIAQPAITQELNDYVKFRIIEYEFHSSQDSDYYIGDDDLWQDFRANFKTFTEETFVRCDRALICGLRKLLRRNGVWVRQEDRASASKALFEVLQMKIEDVAEHTWQDWTTEELRRIKDKEYFRSRALQRRIEKITGLPYSCSQTYQTSWLQRFLQEPQIQPIKSETVPQSNPQTPQTSQSNPQTPQIPQSKPQIPQIESDPQVESQSQIQRLQDQIKTLKDEAIQKDNIIESLHNQVKELKTALLQDSDSNSDDSGYDSSSSDFSDLNHEVARLKDQVSDIQGLLQQLLKKQEDQTKLNTAVPVKSNTVVPTKSNTAVPIKSNTAVPVKSNTAVPIKIKSIVQSPQDIESIVRVKPTLQPSPQSQSKGFVPRFPNQRSPDEKALLYNKGLCFKCCKSGHVGFNCDKKSVPLPNYLRTLAKTRTRGVSHFATNAA